METAVQEKKSRTGLVEQAGVQDENQECMVAQEAESGKENISGLKTVEVEFIIGDDKERVAAIKKDVLHGIREYFETASPSMKIAAVLINKLMLTTGLHDFGRDVMDNLERDVFDDKAMEGEDAESTEYWRGLICGIDFTTYLI